MANDPFPPIARPTWFGKATRKSVSEKEVEDAAQQIRDNPDYEKNGWAPQDLAIYFKEQSQTNSDKILHRVKVKPKRTNGWHNPHRWRK